MDVFLHLVLIEALLDVLLGVAMVALLDVVFGVAQVALYFTLLLVTNMQALGELLEKKQP